MASFYSESVISKQDILLFCQFCNLGQKGGSNRLLQICFSLCCSRFTFYFGLFLFNLFLVRFVCLCGGSD